MMDMEYKGYRASTRFSVLTQTYYGEVTNCHANIVFQATQKSELRLAFEQAVNHYLSEVDGLLASLIRKSSVPSWRRYTSFK